MPLAWPAGGAARGCRRGLNATAILAPGPVARPARSRRLKPRDDALTTEQVAVLTNLARDSNGHLRIALNSSALGPGDYDIAFEGLDWRGTAAPQAWARFTIVH